VITFNAPYLPGEPEEPIDLALVGGERGRELIDRFIERVDDHLAPGGRVYLVQSSISGIKETLEKFQRKGLSADVIARRHVFFEDTVVIMAKKEETQSSMARILSTSLETSTSKRCIVGRSHQRR